MDALALKGDEGRGKLRKAQGSCKLAMILGYPNGETRFRDERNHPESESIGLGRRTRGSETSQYPEEKKSNEIPQVVVSERGRAQTIVY